MKIFRNERYLFKDDENVFYFEFFHVCNHESFLTFVV